MLLPLGSFLPRAQQVSWNHLGQLTNVGRRHSQYRGGCARVSSRLIERPPPQPFQQRYLRVREQRNLRIRQNEVLLLIKRSNFLAGSLSLSPEFAKRPRAQRSFDVAQQPASFGWIVRANSLRQQRLDLKLQHRRAKIVRAIKRLQ